MLSEVVKLIVKTMVLNRLAKHRGTISFEKIEFFFQFYGTKFRTRYERGVKEEMRREMYTAILFLPRTT